MPCSDSSSGLNLQLANDDTIVSFQFAKITCSSEIAATTGLLDYIKGKNAIDVLDLDFHMLVSVLNLNSDDERQFILYLELDALKAAIAQYLGVDHASIDPDRCRISAVEYSEDVVDIALVILPPKELPKIIPCSQG